MTIEPNIVRVRKGWRVVIEIIEKQKIAGRAYEIRVDGNTKYRLSGMFTFLGGVLNISDDAGNSLGCVRRGVYLIHPKYEITLPSGQIFRFGTQSALKGIYTCSSFDSQYLLYAHKGLRASVYRNDRQIAALVEAQAKVLNADYYSMLADDDADDLLLACIGVVFDSLNEGVSIQINGGIYGINLGNIVIRRDHQFDESWRPRQSRRIEPTP